MNGAEEYGVPLLLAFYRQYARKYVYSPSAAERLCSDVGVHLRESRLDWLDGRFYPANPERRREHAIVKVPAHSTVEERAFVIYHELAHWKLSTGHEFFRSRLPGFCSGRVREEYWCDAFATAMLFAWTGVHVLPAENPEDFFTAGTEVKGVESNKRIHDHRDVFQGNRIRALSSRCVGNFQDRLLGLGEKIVMAGAQRLAKTFF